MKYRAEIDGLRAVAVVPAILFHAGFELFNGGFVGVDVFFVISGYLITTILIEDIENNRFSLINFYERRARRILPALFFVMLVCIPFAWMWMLTSQMKDFSESLVAASLFTSNILFWRESGYFAAAAEEKPLLHTWSLAVEEQYYILFPVFLFLAWRFGRNRVFWMIIVFAAISLLISEWGWRNKPIANFYLMPARVWELFAGSIAAFIVQKQGVRKNNALSLLGLAAIVFAIFAYDETTPFPSVYALVPVLGVVFLVLYADKQTLVAKLLSTKAFVGIGLISYSAYLWHQPLFAFARIKGAFVDSYVIVGLIVATIGLSVLSWQYVERPFRKRNNKSSSTIFLISFSFILFFILFGWQGHTSKGFGSRFSAEKHNFLNYFENDLPNWNYFHKIDIPGKYRLECNYFNIERYRQNDKTLIPRDNIDASCMATSKEKPTIFIWGDSHAQQLNFGISKLYSMKFSVTQIASTGCRPEIVMNDSDRDFCVRSNYRALEFVKKEAPEFVFIAQSMKHNADTFSHIASHLKGIGVENIIIVGPTPHWLINLPYILSRDLPHPDRRTESHLNRNMVEVDIKLKDLFNTKLYDDASYISVIEFFCNEDGCLTYIGDDPQTGIVSWDTEHLTPIASAFMAANLFSFLDSYADN